ncbi:PotD/PotF family extracellular solute-binding protein [Pseudorhodobacter sp. MZDSW-24AT]|uniref:ABC transporter substrate-binding protein n=1 Tax=Pseudorhodobacter sp. MZDSW-24AT TaxID=2052957 RepID=UPI000C1E18C4|nr:PotD/PotF family extracellular solute-binding protein [Pseudorhodobacter sp. MZDSW-24AT]PJF08538.1 spermidine/putrescine ABC transporter substrate-binding protein [Pseudorhodobacter sp. MZDSW-24AT]
MTSDLILRQMASRNPLRTPMQHSVTRRKFMQGLGAGVAAAGLPRMAAAQSRPLSLLTWDAYADPRLLALWKEQTGGDIRYEIHISDPSSVNRLRAGETSVWDFINVNNPWARGEMWPAGLIRELPRDRFEPLYAQMKPKFAAPYPWAMSEDGNHLLGVVQRYETFDFVVNSDVISPELAKDEGWDLFNNPDFAGRYGILAYEDWNVMDICMGAGVHPFKVKTDEEVARFEETAKRWIQNAKLITTDFVQLNLAILNGEIDLYFTGGTYTTAAARLEGVSNLYAITPNSGPADGKGGINWIEINSAVNNPDPLDAAFDFLEFITTPDAAEIVARGNGNFQPVAQMANPDLMARFSTEELAAIQWDEFDERIANAVEFDIVPDYDRLYDIYSAAMRARG